MTGLPAPAPPDLWIALDWGTSRLRAWAMAGDGRPLARRESDRGMAGLAPDAFEPALLALVDDWLPHGRRTPVVACGMVGARQGWAEAAYAPVPCPPLGGAPFAAPAARDPRLAVRIAPGLMQADPPDVMRGEETQIAGYLALQPGFAGTVCLPGTHTKWVTLREGRVMGFRTVMTGELFGLLAQHSVLRHSVGQGWDQPAFEAAVCEAHDAPESLLSRLFGLRAASLLQDLSPDAARAALSGLLIGAEIAAARPGGGPIVVIGAEALARNYAAALALTGARVQLAGADEATLAGLVAARAILGENTA